MMEPSNDRRAPITPQLALRVAILGGVAFALFAIIFFRLWYLQVLSGDKFLAQATVNRVRELRIQAPRGKIVDRSGTVIVQNRRAVVVELDPSTLPDEERDLAADWGQKAGERDAKPKGHKGEPIPIPKIPTAELKTRYRRLGAVLGSNATAIHRQVVHSLVVVPYSAIRLKTDVSTSLLAYISERPEKFPGVKVEQTYLRDYPRDTLAAQILGTIGEISPEERKLGRFRGVKAGAIIGKDGLERQYDRYLRGGRRHAAHPGRRGGTAGRQPAPAARRADRRPAPAPVARRRPAARRPGGVREHRAAASPGRSSRWTRATVRSRRWDRRRRSIPRRWPRSSPRSATTRCSARRPARRCSTVRSPASTRPARRSRRSPRSRAWRRTSSRRRRRSTTRAASRSARSSAATPRRRATARST